MKKLYILITWCMLAGGCEKPDNPVVLPPKKGSATATAALGETYDKQVWFSLEDGSWKDTVQTCWDLGFESSSTGWRVTLNGGKFMLAVNTQDTFLLSGSTAVPAGMRWDTPNGHPDSTAISQWLDTATGKGHGHVYVIDRGEVFYPAADRFWKIQLMEANSHGYALRWCRLNGGQPAYVVLPKNSLKNKVYFNFEKGAMDLEPPADNWHLLFTRYRHLYTDMNPVFPYLVTGVLLHPGEVVCHKDSLIGYDSMTFFKAQPLTFFAEQNYIGFEWKDFDRNTNKYTIKKQYCYVVKDRKGRMYKFRFLDFYNSQGQKGYPKIEYRRLN